MARRRRPELNLTAAASIQAPTIGNDPRYKRWQDEAWARYHNQGELYAAVTWKSDVMSRARLVAAAPPDAPGDEPEPLEEGLAVDLVESVGSGIGGQSSILRSVTIHLEVPGEGWLVVTNGGETWEVYAADEIKSTAKGWEAKVEGKFQVLPPQSRPIRIWRPDDQYHWQALSPTRPALAALRRLELIDSHIQAISMSRVAMNGLTLYPAEATFPINPKFADQPDPFVAELMDTASTAVQNPGSASAAIGLWIRVAGDLIDKFKHLDFTTKYDERILEVRESAVRSLATTMDIPAEILLGIGDLNHWSAWQVEESALKVHIQSLLELICDALTDSWLRPALEAEGEDPESALVWYDVTELSVRPDKSKSAIDMVDRGLISDEAARRETGFSEADAPEPVEPSQPVVPGQESGNGQGPPGTRNMPPPPPGEMAPAV